jgi:hypothetical protein
VKFSTRKFEQDRNIFEAYLTIGGLLFFLCMLIFSIVYFKERMLYYDSANNTFKLVQFENFAIPALRYSKLLVQLIPVALLKLNFSLKIIVISYSVSFVLLYYTLFHLAVFKLKNLGAGLLIIFVLVVGVRHAFYYTTTETPQGLAYLGLFLAWLYFSSDQAVNGFKFYSIGLLIILLAFFSHPITLFPLLFIIGFHMIDTKSFKKSRAYILIGIIALIYIAKFAVTPANSYEGSFFSRFVDYKSLLNDFGKSYSFRFMKPRMYSIYLITWIGFLITSSYYFVSKKYLKLAFYLAFSGIFIIILFLTFQKGDSNIAMEKNIMPLNFIILMPIIIEIFRRKDVNIIRISAYLLLAFSILWSSYHVFNTRKVYHKRIVYLEQMINVARQQDNKKFIIKKEVLNPNKIMVEYALSTETLLLTSIEGPDSSLTIHYVSNRMKNKFRTDMEDLFFFTQYWPTIPMDQLNKRFFHLPDGKYSELKEID